MFSIGSNSERELASSDPGASVDTLNALICGRTRGEIAGPGVPGRNSSGLLASARVQTVPVTQTRQRPSDPSENAS